MKWLSRRSQYKEVLSGQDAGHIVSEVQLHHQMKVCTSVLCQKIYIFFFFFGHCTNEDIINMKL